jgi:hypothetical protein
MNHLRPRANEGPPRFLRGDRRHNSLDDGDFRDVDRQLCFSKRAAQLCQLPKTLATIGTRLEMPTNISLFVG